ncbi:hypothetical protein TcasGA2_TC034154 [Tribolium castaneum]|uniref:Uncharacterized protein n=1 Tax=Tribolium castaneum TaxID=7070 RepID=A0A139WCW8_TRICA|nr:hypothetical protein TcasGA2_TC034154 [Tribolium castaneum]
MRKSRFATRILAIFAPRHQTGRTSLSGTVRRGAMRLVNYIFQTRFFDPFFYLHEGKDDFGHMDDRKILRRRRFLLPFMPQQPRNTDTHTIRVALKPPHKTTNPTIYPTFDKYNHEISAPKKAAMDI